MKPPSSTTSPVSLLEAARSFEQAAAGMMVGGELPLHHQVHAFYLLAGFGIEVGLKSLLRSMGVDDFPELKRIGHDLNEAMVAVAIRSEDRSYIPDRLPEVVGILSPIHAELTMRYTPASGSFTLPHPTVTIGALQELLDVVALKLLQDGAG